MDSVPDVRCLGYGFLCPAVTRVIVGETRVALWR
jgi:hypothetical protein